MPRAILLIDMDAFFASVEQARRPELQGQPVIVGGRAESRGVVSTASYEARACGVRTAMPMAQALRRCPQGVFLPVDMAAYKAVQQQLLAIYGRFTDLVEPVSIDEAFLDVTGSRRLFGSPQEIAAQIQRLTRDELGLSCSIGIGPTQAARQAGRRAREARGPHDPHPRRRARSPAHHAGGRHLRHRPGDRQASERPGHHEHRRAAGRTACLARDLLRQERRLAQGARLRRRRCPGARRAPGAQVHGP